VAGEILFSEVHGRQETIMDDNSAPLTWGKPAPFENRKGCDTPFNVSFVARFARKIVWGSWVRFRGVARRLGELPAEQCLFPGEWWGGRD
jgi:hypothetical protein